MQCTASRTNKTASHLCSLLNLAWGSTLWQVLCILGTPFLLQVRCLEFFSCLDKPAGGQKHFCNIKNKEMKNCFSFYMEELTLWCTMRGQSKQLIFQTMPYCKTAGQLLQLQNWRYLQETNSPEMGYNCMQYSLQWIRRDCKPQGHLISSLRVNVAFCCPPVTLGYRND